MGEKRELGLKELSLVAGGRKRIGTWYVITLKDGTKEQCRTYEQAVEWANKHGGGTIEAVSGALGKRR